VDDISRHFYGAKFDSQFLYLTGNAFQDFFAALMERVYPDDYVKSRPYGNTGDMKCDGYMIAKQVVFAVYAPQTKTEPSFTKKIEEDFNGAMLHWKDKCSTWIFVHNNPNGLGPGPIQKIAELRASHPGIKIRVWEYPHIKKMALELDKDSLIDLFGYAPTLAGMQGVSAELISELLNGIAGKDLPDPRDEIREVPPKKLEINKLSEDTEVLLRVGMTKVTVVEDFVSHHYDQTYGDRTAQVFKKKYLALRAEKLAPDLIFSELQRFVGGEIIGSSQRQNNILAILSYFFEQCEIFEGMDE
jgi:hypothetical protein